MKEYILLLFNDKKVSIVFALLAITYLLQAVLVPPTKAALNKYHLTASRGIMIVLSIAIPYVIIWIIALVGYLRLKSYTKAIEGSKDGAAFQIISRGVLWLALWLPLSAVMGSFITHAYSINPAATASLVRLNNYFNFILLVPGFLYINQGSKRLLGLIKLPVIAPSLLTVASLIGAEALYVFVVFHDPARQFPTSTVDTASYYLSDWLILLTIIIPRLIIWYIGFQAVHNLYLYRKKVRGSIYRASLKNFTIGVGAIVTTSVLLRVTQSVSTTLSSLSLGLFLVIIYTLLIIAASGYVMIAKGSRSLQQIEDL